MNVMLVLGIQQIGGGGSDAMKLLTFLCLPNAKSIKDRSFKRIEDAISSVIIQYEEEIKHNAVCEEVMLTLLNQNREKIMKNGWPMTNPLAARPLLSLTTWDGISIVMATDMTLYWAMGFVLDNLQRK